MDKSCNRTQDIGNYIYSGRTKQELTCREVELDFVGWSANGRNVGLWGICRLRNRNVRCFKPDSVVSWRYIGNSFEPNPHGRWEELIPVYKQKGLAQMSFQ
jgi:hypothetical protein